MSKSTTIITTTTALSDIAGTIAAGAATRAPTKQHVLNTIARGIAGAKHDWGFLTGATGPVIQKGMPERRLAEIGAPDTPDASSAARVCATDGETLEIVAEPAALYDQEMADYFGRQLTGDLIAVVEDFSTDTQDGSGVQCMLEPAAIFARDDTLSLAPRSLWGGSPDLIERAGRAYFAASSSARVNDLIAATILHWPEEAQAHEFKAFHFAHAIVVAPEYPFNALAVLAEEEDEDTPFTELIGGAIRIFVDETLAGPARTEALAGVESFLNRLAVFLRCDDPRFANIAVR